MGHGLATLIVQASEAGQKVIVLGHVRHSLAALRASLAICPHLAAFVAIRKAVALKTPWDRLPSPHRLRPEADYTAQNSENNVQTICCVTSGAAASILP
jgi:hypothetical protein